MMEELDNWKNWDENEMKYEAKRKYKIKNLKVEVYKSTCNSYILCPLAIIIKWYEMKGKVGL